MAKAILPRIHALLVCNDYQASPGEVDVYTLFGVRTQIQASTFPHIQPQLYVYLQAAGHAGEFSARVAGVSARTDDVVFEQAVPPITLTDPVTLVPVLVLIEHCEFPEPGIYYFQVYFGEKLVHERPLHVVESEATANGQQGT
jgi:hypothetical protein